MDDAAPATATAATPSSDAAPPDAASAAPESQPESQVDQPPADDGREAQERLERVRRLLGRVEMGDHVVYFLPGPTQLAGSPRPAVIVELYEDGSADLWQWTRAHHDGTHDPQIWRERVQLGESAAQPGTWLPL